MEEKMIVFILLFLTVLLWGTSPIIEKTGLSNTTPFVGLTIRSLGVSIILVITLTLMGQWKTIFSVNPRTALLFVLSGTMAGLLGMWAYFAALKAGATSQIVPIAASYPLITALLSIFILKEDVTWVRLMGTCLIIAGIWLVK
jgi:transporter family protein